MSPRMVALRGLQDAISELTCPLFSPIDNWNSTSLDLHRETTPKFAGDFGLRDSVCAGFTGTFAVSVAQVSTSSNRVEGLFPFAMIPVVVVRGKVGNARLFLYESYLDILNKES